MSAAVAILSGCAQSRYSSTGPWDWTPPPRLQAGNAGSSSAVIVSPGRADAQFFAYANNESPEYDRRDDSLNIRSNDPYAGWLEYPEVERPTLSYQRSFRTSRDPNRYTYPTTSSDYGRNRSGARHRGHGRRRY